MSEDVAIEGTEPEEEVVAEEPVVDGEGEGEAVITPEEDKSKEEAPEGKEEPEADKEAGSDDARYFYDGQEVDVVVPDDLNDTLKEAGVDVQGVVNELYAEGGDFSLTDETRKPLDEKYGKPVVDAFIGSLKAQNDSALKSQKEAASAAEAADLEASEWSDELVGGEAEWTAMQDWAAENLEESQVESFNKAMQSGDKWMQELAIKSLHSQFRDSEGDSGASLITGEASREGAGSPLSSQDYLKEMTSPTFSGLKGEDKQKAQAALDNRRRAGIKRGI